MPVLYFALKFTDWSILLSTSFAVTTALPGLKLQRQMSERFGEQIPFCEPYWYARFAHILCLNVFVCFVGTKVAIAVSVVLVGYAYSLGYHSPYYHEGHRKFRAICRKFVDEELRPHTDEVRCRVLCARV